MERNELKIAFEPPNLNTLPAPMIGIGSALGIADSPANSGTEFVFVNRVLFVFDS